MKGQYLTIEYVLFFAIGIAMVVGVYVLFTNINENTRADSINMQLEKTNELIRDSIVNVYNAGSRTDSLIIYNLQIPARLSGHIYTVKYDGNINVNSTQNYKIGSVLTLYNINIKPSANIYSTQGKVQIKYDNGWVELL
ncbi:MAG: hypothetical protein PHU12_01900 [Candidatus Aenigmarchaeota archaeon]|nr:hypothetical protein [Candidatus Aenigmarchaeota archaeon]